jgi:hypothetical protein
MRPFVPPEANCSEGNYILSVVHDPASLKAEIVDEVGRSDNPEGSNEVSACGLLHSICEILWDLVLSCIVRAPVRRFAWSRNFKKGLHVSPLGILGGGLRAIRRGNGSVAMSSSSESIRALVCDACPHAWIRTAGIRRSLRLARRSFSRSIPNRIRELGRSVSWRPATANSRRMYAERGRHGTL